MIERYKGQRVTVYYMDGDNSDQGVLVEYDGQFMRLERRNDKDLLIPIYSIRIIVVDPQNEGGKKTLPRPT